MSTIPAGAIVSITPGVIGAGGNALTMTTMAITKNQRVPLGVIAQFASYAAVVAYFGAATQEAVFAQTYFAGFDNSTVKPGKLYFVTRNVGPASAYLRGGSLASVTLAGLQAFSTGTLTITVDGTPFTSSTINLASATSFSNAATIIQTAFTSPNFAVTFDAISSSFVFTSNSTGATSTITFATGTGNLQTKLALTLATGAVLSQGAPTASNAAAFMAAITAQTTDWACFVHLQDPDAGSGNASKLAYAQWNATQNNRYLFVCWDADSAPTVTVPATSSLGYLLAQSQISGTMLIYGADNSKAAFVCGAVASIDFARTNGRITLAFKSQSGLTPDVTDQTTASNLEANGYNYYGQWATAAQQFAYLYPGSISGPYLFADEYINEIWLNNALQLAMMSLLTQVKSIPYNAAGYALIRAACADPIKAAVNFGAIRAGVSLSAVQVAEVNSSAGLIIDKTLTGQGWYLLIQDATAQVRAARGTPPLSLYYMDGGSVQRINLASLLIQ